MFTPQDRPDAGAPEAPRKSVLLVLGKALWLLVGLWIYPAGPILGLLILVALSSHWFGGFQKHHPALSDLLFVFALVNCFAHIAVEGWLSRVWRKNRDAHAAALAKEQAEFIQAIQEVSYWLDGTSKTEGALRAITAELMTIALSLACKRVEEEIRKKGFKIRDVSVSEIKNAAKALLTAQRPK